LARAFVRFADDILLIETRMAVAMRERSLATKGHGMANGTVKWFNGTKGFGFIQPDDGGQDVFVHISAVERAGLRDLRDGQKISYELVQDKRSGKMSADNLRAE
jgi:CspA family cold shock protein